MPIFLSLFKKIKNLNLASILGQVNLRYDEVKIFFILGQTWIKDGQILDLSCLDLLMEKVSGNPSRFVNDGSAI